MATRKQLKYWGGFYVLVVLIFSGLLANTVSAMTLSPDTAPETVALFDLLAVVVGGEAAAKWITIVGFAAWILTQLMAWLSPAWVAKLPAWLIALLKVMAGNYRKAANEPTNDPEQLRRTL